MHQFWGGPTEYIVQEYYVTKFVSSLKKDYFIENMLLRYFQNMTVQYGKILPQQTLPKGLLKSYI